MPAYLNRILCALVAIHAATPIGAHSPHQTGVEHKLVFDEAYRTKMLAEFFHQHDAQVKTADTRSAQAVLASNAGGAVLLQYAATVVSASQSAPSQALPFMAFAPKVNARWDANFLYVESNGLPDHNMMIGITAWQQQV
ncbi:MAG: hypothetical protein K8R87_02595, partial [Verrucomicrobia bacterium]|nr:hypothetical protein [Verrucomicrobiota bacterium]